MKSGSTNDNRGSVLLKSEENELVFRMIGKRCQCLAAGVIQLYLTEPPLHNEWIKRNTGIITLIRDNPKRSYYLRLYCIHRCAMLWEHEVYNSMDYKSNAGSYFHTFEGEECLVAFNFASEVDAITLRGVLLEKLAAKQSRKQKKLEMHGVTLPRKSQSSSSPSLGPVPNRNMSNGSPSLIGVNRSMSNISVTKVKKKNVDRNAKKKLTAGDIGLPFDFRHVHHCGLNADNIDKGIEDELLKFFQKAGVSESQLENKRDRKFIYNFIEVHGGMDAVLEATSSREQSIEQLSKSQPKLYPPPPVPARTVPVSPNIASNNSHQRKAPPLPPSRTQVPPTPLNVPPVHRTVPTRPPPPMTAPAASSNLPPPPPPMMPQPPVSNNNSPVPPPPPPPLPNLEAMNQTEPSSKLSSSTVNNGGAMIPDPRATLMECIRNGTTLKKVSKDDSKPIQPTGGDSRNDLLQQIRQGIELKPVSSEPRPSSAPDLPKGGLADALSRALAERAKAIQSESDNSTSDTSDDNTDWDD